MSYKKKKELLKEDVIKRIITLVKREKMDKNIHVFITFKSI